MGTEGLTTASKFKWCAVFLVLSYSRNVLQTEETINMGVQGYSFCCSSYFYFDCSRFKILTLLFFSVRDHIIATIFFDT